MRIKMYLLSDKNDSTVRRMIATKEFDDESKVNHALKTYEKHPAEWIIEDCFLLETDLYERLPQYHPVKIV